MNYANLPMKGLLRHCIKPKRSCAFLNWAPTASPNKGILGESMKQPVQATTRAFSDLSVESKCYVLGIAGGTGSGKTTIANRLVSRVGVENVAHLSHDSYYKDLSHLTLQERNLTNFDHPNSLETDLFIKHIAALKRGETVEVPLYDFTTHSRIKKTRRVEAKSILIVEGILLFHETKLRNVLDAMVFIDTQNDIRFIRRMKRDIEERGRTVDSITGQYLNSVRPMHMQFVQPSKQFADLILPGGNNLDVAVDILSVRLENCLKKNDSVDKIGNKPSNAADGQIFDMEGRRIM